MKNFETEANGNVLGNDTPDHGTAYLVPDDEIQQKKASGTYLRKDFFLNEPQEVEIRGLSKRKNQWEKWQYELVVFCNGNENRVTINERLHTWLIDNIGKTPGSWKGKKIVVSATEFEGNETAQSGLSLNFKLP